MLKKILAAFALVAMMSGPAMAADPAAPAVTPAPVAPVSSLEEDIVKAMMIFCMPPVIKNLDPATMAVAMKMKEMPAENARRFDPSGGRVFGVPSYPENILIIAGKNGACSVVARDFNTDKFWAQADIMFSPDSPFKLVDEKNNGNGRQKTYEANYSGPTVLFVSARDTPEEGMLQGILTFARIAQ